jgi:opacity protein-like surface antigen
MKTMKTLTTTMAAALVAIAVASPAAAQSRPYLSVRPFVMISEQEFRAVNTFEAIYGQANEMFWGGGVSLTQEDRYYLDVTASQFKKTGQRAFRTVGGEVFRLGIADRITITPLEFTGGYRFHRWKRALPYVGAGIGLYRYKESSDFATADENVDTRHAGAIVEGGVEFRLHRWIGAGVDAHFTHVPGILGDAGISKDVSEQDLGGISARVRVIVGR